MWLMSPMRYEVIKNARIGRGMYKCVLCSHVGPVGSIQIDHVEGLPPVEQTTEYVQALFYGEQRPLCKACHQSVTESQRIERQKK